MDVSAIIEKSIKNRYGFTLTELMIAVPLAVAILGLTLGTYISMDKMVPGGIAQVVVQSYGRSILDRIAQDIRLATEAYIEDAGDTLVLTIDPNGTYDVSSDDMHIAYYVSGGKLFYDPDIYVSGDEVVLLEGVEHAVWKEEGGQILPYFQRDDERWYRWHNGECFKWGGHGNAYMYGGNNGNIIIISFRIRKQSGIFADKTCSMTTSVKMRNTDVDT